MDVQAFHDAIHRLLREVSRTIILPHYQALESHQVVNKDTGGISTTGDVVTVADNLAEELLTEGLEKIVPGLPVVGEEAAHADPAVLDRLPTRSTAPTTTRTASSRSAC